MLPRNDPLGFANRTLKNLQYIEKAQPGHSKDVHVVTQLIVSLLGLVVFPKENHLPVKVDIEDHIKDLLLADLIKNGWPEWDITYEATPTKTLGHLWGHIRNAVAHGRLSFDSDSPNPSKVIIELKDVDFQKKDHPVTWQATIRADRLRMFCEKFIELLRSVQP